MPKLVDHNRRRIELVEAVWRVVRRDGVCGASVRGVASEAGHSTGSVRHFFSTQDELLHFAMEELVNRVHARVRAEQDERLALVASGDIVAAVVALLSQVLPVTADRLLEAQVWFAFIAHESVDPAVREIRRHMDTELRQLCTQCVRDLAETDALSTNRDLEQQATVLWALVDGLTLRACLDPEMLSAQDIIEALRAHLFAMAGN